MSLLCNALSDYPIAWSQVELLSTIPLDDQLLTGVQFCKTTKGAPLITCSYDNNVIPIITA